MERALKSTLCLLLSASFGAFAPCAWSQLTPEKTYSGISRPIRVQANVPADIAAKGSGEARVDLYEPQGTSPLVSSPIVAGSVDLAQTFPQLWTNASPKVLYAQLTVGGEKVGAPLVLQPLIAPKRATLLQPETREPWVYDSVKGRANFDANTAEVAWINDPPLFTGMRVYVDQHVVIRTSVGEVEVRLRPDKAPNTVWNFHELVRGGYYSDTIVHRIVPKLPSGDPFVVQFGDPTGTGMGGPGYDIRLEPSDLPHDFGVLSMARGLEPDTAGSQVFLCLSRRGCALLDGLYTSFAQTVKGAETIEMLMKQPVDGDRPKEPPKITEIVLVDAPPFGTGSGPIQPKVDAAPAR